MPSVFETDTTKMVDRGPGSSIDDRAGTTVNDEVDAAEGTSAEAGDAVEISGGGRGSSWLPWILAGLATVLILAWLLSQCASETDSAGDDAQAVDTAARDAANDERGAEDADESGSVASTDGGDTSGSDTDGAAPDGSGNLGGLDVTAAQQAVDDALTASGSSGLTATVLDDGTVELSGTVDSNEAKVAAESAVAGIDGIGAITNSIEVEVADDGATEQPTINEELSLDPITFEVSSARITVDGQAVLDQAADYLSANAEVEVEIAGHTDADGEQGANLILSQARAESVKAYLVAKGIDGGRLTAKGYGEAQPVASNDTAAGKADNRRIEFVVR